MPSFSLLEKNGDMGTLREQACTVQGSGLVVFDHFGGLSRSDGASQMVSGDGHALMVE
jgi:hypothetical protein